MPHTVPLSVWRAKDRHECLCSSVCSSLTLTERLSTHWHPLIQSDWQYSRLSVLKRIFNSWGSRIINMEGAKGYLHRRAEVDFQRGSGRWILKGGGKSRKQGKRRKRFMKTRREVRKTTKKERLDRERLCHVKTLLLTHVLPFLLLLCG